MKAIYLIYIGLFYLSVACVDSNDMTSSTDEGTMSSSDSTETDMTMPSDTFNLDKDSQAAVEAVTVSGSENNYNFQVQLKSPDTGCDQYADWWEVFTKEGKLIYRRVLLHSHVTEQPFIRSGGPINIDAETFVYIRGHMNNLGYGSLVFGGTIKDGFEAIELPIDFASDLSDMQPLPDGCAF